MHVIDDCTHVYDVCAYVDPTQPANHTIERTAGLQVTTGPAPRRAPSPAIMQHARGSAHEAARTRSHKRTRRPPPCYATKSFPLTTSADCSSSPSTGPMSGLSEHWQEERPTTRKSATNVRRRFMCRRTKSVWVTWRPDAHVRAGVPIGYRLRLRRARGRVHHDRAPEWFRSIFWMCLLQRQHDAGQHANRLFLGFPLFPLILFCSLLHISLFAP